MLAEVEEEVVDFPGSLGAWAKLLMVLLVRLAM